MIESLDSSLFTWENWRAGSIRDLGIPCRYKFITSEEGISTIKKYAIGYCNAEQLGCRPKINETAIMCVKDNEQFWFHLRTEEFKVIFGEI